MALQDIMLHRVVLTVGAGVWVVLGVLARLTQFLLEPLLSALKGTVYVPSTLHG